jgi:hypothetical protein
MFNRNLFSAALAASLAAAAPALAYDPTGPSADDPSAATWVAPARPRLSCDRSAPPADDPSATTWDAAAPPMHVCAVHRGAPSPDDTSGATRA